jgi:predicted nuclease of restriction endonuclease-like (RecB) superfamily
MSKDKLVENNSLDTLYRDIKTIIEQSKQYAVSQVNRTLVLGYWNIGKLLKEIVLQEERASYGDQTLKKLSKKLTLEYGSGFSKSNLTRMVNFYSYFADDKIVATLSQQLSWSHFVELLKLQDDLKREFYLVLCSNEKWSVRTLRERINSMLYERTAISKKPEQTIKNDLLNLSQENKMSTALFLRDPYFLDFLELRDNYSEKDLENAILMELERFILEFGNDFAFLSRQKRISIGGNDYYLDLLFYHRKLRRLVLIELKIGDFMPEHKGQVELYLKWLSKYEKQEFEKEPIALILCSGTDKEVVELMDMEKDNIHISEYWLKLPPKQVLREKLHKAIECAKAKMKK